MVRRQLMVAVAILAVAAATLAQEKEIKRLDGSTIKPVAIDETVKKLMAAAEVPGVGLALFNDGKIVYVKAYGERDKEKNLPLTADSIMSGASFSKVVFGYLVLQLADKRTLDLDKLCGAPKPHDEHVDAPVHAADERLLKKGREPRSFGRDPLHALQLRSYPSKPADHASDGGGRDDDAVVVDRHGAGHRGLGSIIAAQEPGRSDCWVSPWVGRHLFPKWRTLEKSFKDPEKDDIAHCASIAGN